MWRVRDRYYDRKKKRSSSHLSGGCAIAITTGKKSSSRLSGGCAIVIMTGKKNFQSSVWRVRDSYYNQKKKKVLVICLAGARSLLRPEKKKFLSGARSLLRPEKKSSSRLSSGCAIVITTRKIKSSSRLSGGCAIVITTRKNKF